MEVTSQSNGWKHANKRIVANEKSSHGRMHGRLVLAESQEEALKTGSPIKFIARRKNHMYGDTHAKQLALIRTQF